MTPRATYRLQFHQDFGFRHAAQIAPYLARLGISHVYASPWLKARSGSSHGYDIVDHRVLNPELGSDSEFHAMIAAFNANGLRSIMDFVPNHMGVGGSDNPLWLDVLEWGPDSAHAGWFDIDWQSGSYLHDKLLVPFLGDQYGVELYAGKLILKFDEHQGSFAVWAYDSHKLPICPLHYGRLLGDAHPELERLGDAFRSLPEWRPHAGRRAGDLKAELANCAIDKAEVRDAIAASVQRFNGVPGQEETWKALHELIQAQYWRAANFRVAADDINYRRFFDVNELAGLRMELPEVFDHAHALIFQLLANGTLDGLRIDHVDGLLNPKEYFERLRARQPSTSARDSFYLVVEKILAHHESLRDDWPVDGTTGYEFANLALGLLIDPEGKDGFTRTFIDFTGERRPFPEVVRECKLRIMRNEMASELNVLAREVARVAHQNPKTADFTHNVLRRAIREMVACFPVYRTYVDFEHPPTEEDRRDLNWAMKQARAISTDIDPSVFEFISKVLSGDLVAQARSGFSRHAVLRCAMKLQQYSGPVMAKGLEDTAFYRYNRFVGLNEVGGDPDQFGASISSFHKANTQRAKRWPHSMLTTSTHDTKRGEDARARLVVLSEMPQEWAKQVNAWSRILRARRGDVEATAPPDRNDEYLFYQLLIGTWPVELTGGNDLPRQALQVYADRIKAAMTKSMREAKVHSTWASPGTAYENAVLSFIDATLNPEESRGFFLAFLPFQAHIARLGIHNSLVQTTLKLTAPGVPDIYQGADLWDLSLVDPDNRRPVDYQQRMELLARLPDDAAAGNEAYLRNVLDNWQDGAIKLYVISRILALRAAEPELFAQGDYQPLIASGPKADCLCAFARRAGDRLIVVMIARFPARLENDPGWSGTGIPLPRQLGTETLRNVLTGGELLIQDGIIDAGMALAGLPVAVFTQQRNTSATLQA
jgi:(1->4)-alpha-D-glucan 1-alpha-D-glucosylmutase